MVDTGESTSKYFLINADFLTILVINTYKTIECPVFTLSFEFLCDIFSTDMFIIPQDVKVVSSYYISICYKYFYLLFS